MYNEGVIPETIVKAELYSVVARWNKLVSTVTRFVNI